VTAPDGLRQQLRTLTCTQLVGRATRWRGAAGTDPLTASRLAIRSVARRHQALTIEVKALDRQMQVLVGVVAPHLLGLTGVGYETATTLLVTAGDNPERLRSEASFAQLCGVAPIPASSGRTVRHRLNRAGARQANRALFLIVLVRMFRDHRTQVLRCSAHRRGSLKARNHPLPQALRGAGGVCGLAPNTGLTVIGASLRPYQEIYGQAAVTCLSSGRSGVHRNVSRPRRRWVRRCGSGRRGFVLDNQPTDPLDATGRQHIVGISKTTYVLATPRSLNWRRDLQRTSTNSGRPHPIAGVLVLPGHPANGNYGLWMRAGRGGLVPRAGASVWRYANYHGGSAY